MISLLGLVHKIDHIRQEELTAGDGMGGSAYEKKLQTKKVLCRITELTAEAAQKEYGLDTGRYWKVLTTRYWNFDDEGDDFILLSELSRPAPIKRMNSENTLLYYRILRARIQQDDVGNRHHMSLVVELEDVDING